MEQLEQEEDATDAGGKDREKKGWLKPKWNKSEQTRRGIHCMASALVTWVSSYDRDLRRLQISIPSIISGSKKTCLLTVSSRVLDRLLVVMLLTL